MNKGFTLIETLVTLAIIVLLTSIIIFNTNTQRQDASLFRSAQTLSLNLRRAQNFALSSKKFRNDIYVPCGWGVHFNGVGSATYIIFADKAVNINCSDRDYIRASNGSEDFETVNLESGITINSLSNNLSDIVFTPPDPLVVFTPSQTSVSIILRNQNGGTRTVNINKFGFISSP